MRRAQPLPIRVAHWLNVPLLVILGGSGLQILAAYPYMGSRGALFSAYPLQGAVPPGWVRLGGWLAGARALHFAFGWLFLLNGLTYLVYLLLSGEWRRRAFVPRRDLPNAVETAAHYLLLRRAPPPAGLYNGLQRLAYTLASVLGVLSVLSGLAIWKPVQLWWLVASLGGYDVARYVHLLVLVLLAGFVLVHVLLVSFHPRTIVAMVFGGAKDGAPGDA